jgi:hypothetical protein
VVFLPLEIDAACSNLIAHFARKSAVLLEAWCYNARGDREQDLWTYWLPERCVKQWYDKPTGHGWLQVVWARGAMKQWHCCISYLDQAPCNTEWNHKIQNMILTNDHTLHWQNR